MDGDDEHVGSRDYSIVHRIRNNPWYRYQWYLRLLILVVLVNLTLAWVAWVGVI